MQISNFKFQIKLRGVALENNPSVKELKFGTRKIMAQIKLWCRISLSEAVKALNVLLKPSERLEQMRLFSKATGPQLILVIIGNLILVFILARSASAQDISFGIYPPISEIEAKTPADIKSPVLIENLSDSPIDLNISYKAFVPAQSEDGKVEFLDNFETLPDPLITKKVFIMDGANQTTSLTLSPKQKKNLIMEIILPFNQPKGDYYFSVIFTSSQQGINLSNTSLQTGAISMNVLLTVGPKGKTNGILEDFSSPLFVDSGPVAFNVAVKNTSNHFIQPRGEIIIKNMFGQAIGKVSLLQVNILADSTRRMPDTLQITTDKKQYEKIRQAVEKNQFPVAVWPEKFLLGPYTATLTLSLSDQGPVFKKSVHFFAFPISFIVAIITVLAITIFIILRVRQKID